MVVDKRHLHPAASSMAGCGRRSAIRSQPGRPEPPPMHDFTTIELKLNVFTAGVLGDELICEARPFTSAGAPP